MHTSYNSAKINIIFVISKDCVQLTLQLQCLRFLRPATTLLGRLALDTADRSHLVQDIQRGSEPVLQPRRFPDVADVGTDDLKKSLYACFFSTSKNNRQLSHNMRHLRIIFVFYMKVRKLELADCSDFIRLERGNLLNL